MLCTTDFHQSLELSVYAPPPCFVSARSSTTSLIIVQVTVYFVFNLRWRSFRFDLRVNKSPYSLG